ncbi:alpha/beta hydrolase family protein [Desulfatitalea alkaliphila]|uniref:Esterase FrsA n=1 Tax=Desulfatitalea alkaliphila TaxID=2929485 RepID=A0AA41UHL5_9BACT|nr:alpha/beta fold hydrolase [Desulfatitalea alkaliphila]MCJ8499740.1 esterase FrsA [Desulfatitalea alkaliphila]
MRFIIERSSALRFWFLVFGLCLFLQSLSGQGTVWAAGGIDPADPMVRITYARSDLDVPKVLARLSREVTAATGIEERFITYYWQTFDAIHCMGEPVTDKPLFVDLYVPGFFTDQDVAGMMTAIADALANLTAVDKQWVFIHTHFPLDGHVYISGKVEHWDNYRGKTGSSPRDISQRAMSKFLFNDTAFVFQSLWRFGLIATGGADLGELLTITGQVTDYDPESWYQAWHAMAVKVRATGNEFAATGHDLAARQAYFRASNYFRAAAIYMYDKDPRGRLAWQNGRDTFLKAAELSGGLIEPVRIPYERTTLPGYFLSPDNSAKRRPLLLIQTGLDATAEDLYFILGALSVQRGYNCLIFEGPGQGEMISAQRLPFRHDWEQVVTPVVDYALSRPDVDPQRVALLGYSMGGYLVPRALAFEKRIHWGIVDGGVYSVFDGTMTKFPDEVRQAVASGKCSAEIDAMVLQEMDNRPDVRQFITQMLWTFQAETPCELFTKLQAYTLEDVIGEIQTEMLVVNSSQDQVAGSNAQAKKVFQALEGQKTYLEFDASQGGQFHCQLGAPVVSSERILNWLDERARP